MIDFRILSPMEKVFLDTAPAADARQTRFEGFQNECVSFQAAVMSDDAPARPSGDAAGAIAPGQPRARAEAVRSVPVTLATLPGADDNYLRKTPGLYPRSAQRPAAHAPASRAVARLLGGGNARGCGRGEL